MDAINTRLDEIFEPWLIEVQSEWGTGINDDKEPHFLAIEKAKNEIKDLLSEVRLEEVNNLIGLDLVGTIKRFENMSEYLNRRFGEIVSDQKDIE